MLKNDNFKNGVLLKSVIDIAIQYFITSVYLAKIRLKLKGNKKCLHYWQLLLLLFCLRNSLLPATYNKYYFY